LSAASACAWMTLPRGCRRLEVLVPRGAVLLQLFLEFPQLTFHLFDHAVEGRQHRFRPIYRYELVMVLGRDPQFDARLLTVLHIDRDVDRGHAIEKLADSPHLLGDFFLRSRAQMAVACRNADLHRSNPQEDQPIVRGPLPGMWKSSILPALREPRNPVSDPFA